MLKFNKTNVNYSFEVFLSKINAVLDKHAPYKTLSKKQQKTLKKPWITKGIRKSIQIKYNIHKKFCKAKNEQRKNELHTKWKQYRNLIIKLIRKSKDSYFKTFFKENKKNALKVWQGVRTLINIKTATKMQPKSLNIKGNLITKNIDIATEFNTFFNTIASKIDGKIIPTNTTFQSTLDNPNNNTLFLSPTIPEEVESTIKHFDNRKATGPNSIPTKVLKSMCKQFSIPLSELINLVFTTGKYPDILKLAKIVPIFKKNDPLFCNNYRPISLLSNIGKLIEKLLYQRLYSFLEENKCLYENQFGFRNHHSTNHALITITEKIRKTLDNNEYMCGIFLDFQKAFDTVNHKILLSKLNYYGVRGITLDLFESYLTSRKQFTHVNGTDSPTVINTYGVPQGSVLGPLLFLIYINDLHKVVKHSTTHHFADDTNLLYPNASLKTINKHVNHDLRLIVHWLRANRISLNVDKTEIIIFRPKRKTITRKMNFRISGQKINIGTQTKYLGLILDEHLTWTHHIKILKTKLSRANGLLAKIRYFTSKELLRTIYYALFDSHLRYGCQIWGQSNAQLINEIALLQRKGLRIITFNERNTPTDPLYKDLKIFKVHEMIQTDNCLLALNHINKTLPTVFNDFFQYTNNQHNHLTRDASKNKIITPQVKTTQYGLHSIKYKTAKDWNQIQQKLATFNFQNDYLPKSKFVTALKAYFFAE